MRINNWRIAREYEDRIRLAGTYEQHVLIEHAREAYDIFMPHIEWVEVTSANDQDHSPGSLHYADKALDFRIWCTEKWQQKAVVRYLNHKYEEEDWVSESDHIHGEFDPT